MTQRRALVTGGSKGIGRAVAGALAEQGWRVALIGRDRARLERARAGLAGSGHEIFALDVADESAWKRLAPSLGDVQGLVCAAAVLDPIGPVGTYSVSAFRRTVEVNLVGTLLAIEACLPGLRATGGAVVGFGGGGATAPLRRFDAYAASKVAVVRLCENISAELVGSGVRINCVAPGFVATDIHQATLAAGPDLVGEDYFERTRDELERGGVGTNEAAALVCLLLENAPESSFSGKLISAQWDAWREPSFRRRLAEEPDLATLRRIDGALFTAAGERASA